MIKKLIEKTRLWLSHEMIHPFEHILHAALFSLIFKAILMVIFLGRRVFELYVWAAIFATVLIISLVYEKIKHSRQKKTKTKNI